MSRPFSNNSAKDAFANVRNTKDASSYIQERKTKYSFCQPNICHPNKNINTQSDYIRLREANRLKFYPEVFNKTQLYMNLYTQLDLSGNIPVISYLSNGVSPVLIDTNVTPYLTYNIDPSGVLFGNSVCDITNYEHFITRKAK